MPSSAGNFIDGASRDSARIEAVQKELTEISSEIVQSEMPQSALEAIHPRFRRSVQNLLHYLALRRRDLRPLQLCLAELGLSSLGRAEPHVLATVNAVLRAVNSLAGKPSQPPDDGLAIDFSEGQRLLARHSDDLLGPAAPGRIVRIMVTMPSEAADDYTLVHRLLEQGMDCMRINCAHDEPSIWMQMIENLRRAERSLGRSCRVCMDLAGPKLRTGPIEAGARVVRIRPSRDAFGRVTAPGRVWLTGESAPQPAPSWSSACLPVPAAWLGRLRLGSRIKLCDARGAKRSWRVVDVSDGGCWAEATQTAYVVPGTELTISSRRGREHCLGVVGRLPPTEGFISLQTGDVLILTRSGQPGRPTTRDRAGRILTPATIGCTIPRVFDDVRSGESIWFDDGKIGGVIERVERNRLLIRITQARAKGEKLRGEKGINLPDSNLKLAALTAQDLDDLTFVAEHADVVELSFANTAQDVESLQEHLLRLTQDPPAVVLKIETRRGFKNLPAMLLSAMRGACCGVMIARGDLAVECGFERLAEVQEEILWICEAAHVPVIWATQVLETLAKEGMPSRAEITDAAMGDRAECVMLNKGPHIVSAVRVLDDILRRMQEHQAKKRSMLRELRLAHTLPAEEASEVLLPLRSEAKGESLPANSSHGGP